MKKIWLLVFMTFLFSVGVYADQNKEQVQKTSNARQLNFADFKMSCTNPAQFQAQRPPQDIKIICKDLRYSWVNADAGQVRMPATRTVTSEVYSDKYHVAVDENRLASDDSVGACSRYKEVAQTLSTERAVTCDEILAFQGELHDYCASVTDQVLSANSGAVEIADTGRVIDTCPKAIEKQEQAQKQQQQTKPCKHPGRDKC